MLLYATVMITGAAIMVIEILGTRLLAPMYGTTLYVWASMISTALISLSLGYFAGGALADRRPEYSTFYRITFLAGILLLPIAILAKSVLMFTSPLGPRFGVLASSFILFSVEFILLGSVSPYAIRLKTQKTSTAGRTSGSVYAVATVGSFLGTILTGFYLIPNMDINTIMFLTSLTLIVVSVAGFFISRTHNLPAMLLAVLFFFLWTTQISHSAETGSLVFKKESPYGQIKVIDKDGQRFLLVNGAIQTCKEDNRPCLKYVYTMALAPLLFDEQPPRKALVLGLGGGVLPEGVQSAGIDTDVVEIDPLMVKTAQDYFNYAGDVLIGDGRNYIKSTAERYDIIFQDAFNAFNPAPHLYTLEAFKEIKGALNPEGVLVLNTLGWAKGEGSLVQKSVYATLNQSFKHVYTVPLADDRFTNIIFFASDRPLGLISYDMGEGGIILTDSYNPLEFWSIPGGDVGIKNSLEFFGPELLLS